MIKLRLPEAHKNRVKGINKRINAPASLTQLKEQVKAFALKQKIVEPIQELTYDLEYGYKNVTLEDEDDFLIGMTDAANRSISKICISVFF